MRNKRSRRLILIATIGLVYWYLGGLQGISCEEQGTVTKDVNTFVNHIKFWKDSYLGMEFVWISGGCFNMGCDGSGKNWIKGEKDVCRVCLAPFWMQRHEVTLGQFKRFLKETSYSGQGSNLVSCSDITKPRFHQGDSHPAVCVSWSEANAFAEWLSKKSGHIFRLPTEAEWEYACRAGGGERSYAWGDGDPYMNGKKAANIADASFAKRYPKLVSWKGYDDGFVYTSPVGSFAPNPLGLYDMTGNVWEWVKEEDSRYVDRVRKGGAWDSAPEDLRCSERFGGHVDTRFWVLGFRLVCIGPSKGSD